MIRPSTKFKNLKFGVLKNSKNEEIKISEWDDTKVAMGMAYMKNIKFDNDSFDSISIKQANVDLYLDYRENLDMWFEQEKTQHKSLMIKLGMWKDFRNFKARFFTDGKLNENVNIRTEKEMWYGFTRKGGNFYPTSCTLNCVTWEDYWTSGMMYWTGARQRQQASREVVRKAGIRGADTNEYKKQLVNIIPWHLWEQIRQELKKLTPNDDSYYPIWNPMLTGDKNKKKSMKSLILNSARGSNIYEVDAGFRELRKDFKLFCQVLKELMEEEKKMEAKRNLKARKRNEGGTKLRVLKLHMNNLGNNEIDELFKLVECCPHLERLLLSCNNFDETGCLTIVNSCGKINVNLGVILWGNKGFSISLVKRQRELSSADWLRRDSLICIWFINIYLLVLHKNPDYMLRENLVVPDIKRICGHSSIVDSKNVYDLFYPPSDLQPKFDDDTARPNAIVKMMSLLDTLQECGFNENDAISDIKEKAQNICLDSEKRPLLEKAVNEVRGMWKQLILDGIDPKLKQIVELSKEVGPLLIFLGLIGIDINFLFSKVS